MQLCPYLSFNGDCKPAFEFYARCLGGTIESMTTHAGTPAEQDFPAEWRDRIMHARMVVGDQLLLASDAPPGLYQPLQGIHVSLQIKDVATGERIFNQLAENGKIERPFQQTFWAAGFGMCVDRFGIPWMVNCTQAS